MDIVFPVTPTEIAEAIAVAGLAVLTAAFTIGLGFVLVRKLIARLKGAV